MLIPDRIWSTAKSLSETAIRFHVFRDSTFCVVLLGEDWGVGMLLGRHPRAGSSWPAWMVDIGGMMM